MVTLGPIEDTNGFMLTGCKLENQVDVVIGFLDDWRIRLVDGWFNKSIDDKDGGDDVWTVIDWVLGGSKFEMFG